MGKARPVTDQDRQRVRELHAAGKGRNEIAAELGRSGRTISAIAKDLGLSFARAAEVRAATEVRQADLADRRARFAELLQDDAEQLRARLRQPCTVYSFGGKDNEYAEHTFPTPPNAEAVHILRGIGIAVDKSLRLVPPKDEDGSGEVGSLLTSLFDRLRNQHGDG
ncbi:helix-turn-helix domain-containing protein [Streptomyces sp. CC224B]|uniref:helix-turn-helix domain-containing protein n=1 Tax=Streptomyces sp. CC224B TaxID=3044571 RepID=UPI0024A870BD|nr:helix-turn-helix domain-containing protein [Streptomyces sp. CC224B]